MALYRMLPVCFTQLPEGGKKLVRDWIFMIYPNASTSFLFRYTNN
jgi:hypothetical protein